MGQHNAYYHLAVHQIFMLHKVEVKGILLSATGRTVAQQGGNKWNKQSQLATQHYFVVQEVG